MSFNLFSKTEFYKFFFLLSFFFFFIQTEIFLSERCLLLHSSNPRERKLARLPLISSFSPPNYYHIYLSSTKSITFGINAEPELVSGYLLRCNRFTKKLGLILNYIKQFIYFYKKNNIYIQLIKCRN